MRVGGAIEEPRQLVQQDWQIRAGANKSPHTAGSRGLLAAKQLPLAAADVHRTGLKMQMYREMVSQVLLCGWLTQWHS